MNAKRIVQALLFLAFTFATVVAARVVTVPRYVPDPKRFAVATYHNDVARSGLNARETLLTAENVSVKSFGKLFSYAVDGQVYAQPLYVAGVDTLRHGGRNAVYVATEHNSVYAFDADGKIGQPLWQVSFIAPERGIHPVSNEDVSSSCCIVPEIGITGTPAIDPASDTLYVVAATRERGRIVQRLHALDLRSGAEKFGGPVEITASVPGTGVAATPRGRVVFDARRHLQRGALLLHQGAVHITFGSHGDVQPYHGWLMGYDARTLRQLAVFTPTPNGEGGAFWHSGGGPAVDGDGHLYLVSADGSFTASGGGANHGNSVLKLRFDGRSYTVLDYFAPHNQAELDTRDLDLGAGGPLVVPGERLVIAGSKEGRIYVLDRKRLGGFSSADDGHALQALRQTGPIHSTPAYWNGNVYFTPAGDSLKSFRVQQGRLSPQFTARSQRRFSFPGATVTISANGEADAILWLVHCKGCGGGRQGETAVLHAYDASDVTRELYNSAELPERDGGGPPVKFAVPTVADGKVFVGTQTELAVYGLLPKAEEQTLISAQPTPQARSTSTRTE